MGALRLVYYLNDGWRIRNVLRKWWWNESMSITVEMMLMIRKMKRMTAMVMMSKRKKNDTAGLERHCTITYPTPNSYIPRRGLAADHMIHRKGNGLIDWVLYLMYL